MPLPAPVTMATWPCREKRVRKSVMVLYPFAVFDDGMVPGWACGQIAQTDDALAPAGA
jgi:hypothetical protein